MAKTAQKKGMFRAKTIPSLNGMECSCETDCGCNVKLHIIEKATKRFRHYGYGKTTIADIAEDCEMSAGNIYRYYESKLDIAVAIVRKTTEKVTMETYSKVAKMNSARDRLRALLFGNLRITYNVLEQDPKLVNMMIAVRKQRPEIRRWARKTERKMIAEILEYGRNTKEFSVDCISSAARVIQCLITRFRWSKLTSPHAELKRLEIELEGIFEMIGAALGKGCFLEKIMRRHPKPKDEINIEETQPAPTILPKQVQSNIIQ